MYRTKKIGAIFAIMMMTFGLLSADDIKPNGCKGPSLCTSFPVIDGCGWHFEVGLLLEQMRFFNTGIAFTKQDNAAPHSWKNPAELWTVNNIWYDLDPGLRVGLGYYFEHDEWMGSTNFEWLYSYSTFNQDNSTTGHTVHNPLFSFPSTGQEMKANFYCNYFLLDTYLSRGSFVSQKFEIEPLAGIKASWIYYRCNSRVYHNETDPTNNTTELQVNYQNFWGVGPMFGLNMNFHMCAGWSIYSDNNLSVLLGEYQCTEGTGNVTVEKNPSARKLYYYWDTVCPTLRSTFGLQYDKDIYCERQHFSLKAGFDARYYFNQYPLVYCTEKDTERLRNAPIAVPGYFGMVGFILVAGWDF